MNNTYTTIHNIVENELMINGITGYDIQVASSLSGYNRQSFDIRLLRGELICFENSFEMPMNVAITSLNNIIQAWGLECAVELVQMITNSNWK